MPVTRVDFYLLSSDKPQDRWLIACRLIEKAYLRGHKIFVYCNNKQDAELLDELLWTFKDDSFIPHNLQGEGPEPPPPIQIGYDKEPRGFNDILLNLAAHISPFMARFKRTIEIVSDDLAQKEQCRAHYKEYKSKGYDLHTHPIEL